MTYVEPCAAPGNNPDDWFISRDGKQYPDDDFLTDAEISGIKKAVLRIEGETSDQHRDRVDKAIAVAEADRKRKALQRRRHAKEDCMSCYSRIECRDKALAPITPATHGTWGGYFEEELRSLRVEIVRRNKRITD